MAGVASLLQQAGGFVQREDGPHCAAALQKLHSNHLLPHIADVRPQPQTAHCTAPHPLPFAQLLLSPLPRTPLPLSGLASAGAVQRLHPTTVQ